MALTTTEINEAQLFLTSGDILGFYEYLDDKGDTYARLALAVSRNETWQGQLANGFLRHAAYTKDLNFELESELWSSLNKQLAERHLDTYHLNSGAEPIWNQIQDYHNEVYVLAGLNEDDWLPNKMLNEAVDPAAMWEDWQSNDNPADVWQDSVDADGGGDNFVEIAILSNRTGLTDVENLIATGHVIV